MEPTEDAIDNFVSFTSTTRDQAISFLKANHLDSQKAINAYFEDPTGPTPKATGYHNDKASSWVFSQQDNAPPLPATAPPSRPPSRIDKHNTEQNTGTQDADASASKEGSGQGLSLAEREEKELQRAVAMSLGSDMGQQETGVTSSGQSQLNKATRDHYEENAWAMTVFNSEEVMASPDPEDRKRVEGEPAFIRPNTEDIYLGGFLTILHNIPLAREALLLRHKALVEYGHEPQWWNGQAINLPKIVTVIDGGDIDSNWDDIIHETQRLMSFMDSTKRGFGSGDSLAKLESMSPMTTDSEDAVTRFMEAWHGAAIQADPDNPLTTIFTSHAYKKELFGDYDPENKELFTFEPNVEKEHGQTLYEVLDNALWTDTPGQELDDTWLEHVADVLVFKLDAHQKPNPVDVEIPPVFYPDRYLSSCRDIAREFRSKRLQIQTEIVKLEELIKSYNFPKGYDSVIPAKDILEKAADSLSAPPSDKSSDSLGSNTASAETDRVSKELRAIALKIDLKLKELERRKQSTLESLKEISKTLTEPSGSPSEPPIYKYTLRGVCTKPHVTYVLSDPHSTAGDLMDMDSEPHDNYQWWRISYSAEDGKTRQAEKQQSQSTGASQSGDAVGYIIRKVSEVEVLQAAREEWGSVLLVYASDNATNTRVDPAPPQLQGFVNRDNDAFSAEFEQTPTIVISDQEEQWPSTWSETQQEEKSQEPEKRAPVNVFDYEVSDFEVETKPNQEMQQRGSSGLLSNGTSHAPDNLQDESQWMEVDTPGTNAHIEHA
ncbi:unnamed protein product [Penicillium salamii]|uniref:Ubiquitin interaction motif protein n=1 Tax=Penicillium salamii TaxID=1612424 RepID=A0A9W4K0D5_9EURO|nr:unnamed protein product [Penicillium salamii]CAG8336526.1 unnamed protein product [Penicillium salamii]CAG8338321.1 unnamed protein product [Penicillium salamii]CAG8370976.1 unnamed protein product [Penicillium salamii]CAG8387099.1 unnamed protein product [Penicillium salamii]